MLTYLYICIFLGIDAKTFHSAHAAKYRSQIAVKTLLDFLDYYD